ncbi:M23 family metallopeptidase [Streptomyces phytohabitans]|uniref:M23 family metallopeptidase n=1 Tax=Streptomyces phytohabitans TaxID=1150371 RepID=UPI00387EA7BA
MRNRHSVRADLPSSPACRPSALTLALAVLFVATLALLTMTPPPSRGGTDPGAARVPAPAAASVGATKADGREPSRGWPVEGAAGGVRPVVVRGWEPPPAPWAAGHRGVDLAARAGQAVRAAGAGTVSFAGPVAGRGVVATELSGTGDPPLRTTYEPVRASVAKGERVRAGDVVGTVQRARFGKSGRPGRPMAFHCRSACLHWGLLRGDRYLDPLSLLPPHMLRGGPARLLPYADVPEPREDAGDGGGGADVSADGVRLSGEGSLTARTSRTSAPSGGGAAPLTAAAALAGAAFQARRKLREGRRPTVAAAASTRPTPRRRFSRARRSAPSTPRPR